MESGIKGSNAGDWNLWNGKHCPIKCQ